MTVLAERTALDAARDVAAALGPVRAAYAVGSTSTGGFRPGTSDLDVVAVLGGRPTPVELEALVERARSVNVAPARGLELVVYADGELVLNLNTGPGLPERVDYGEPEGEEFWFVLDRAVAQHHAIALRGAPWRDVFPPVTRAEVLDALAASLRWQEEHHPDSGASALSTIQTWRWLDTGEWVSKPAALAWLRARVRERVEEAR